MDDWGTTERIKAEILLGDGAHLFGELFVQGRVPHHDGPESLVEMLNPPEPFTAVALTGGGVVFLPQAQIAPIRLDFGFVLNAAPQASWIDRASSSFGQVEEIRPAFLDTPL